MKQSDFLRAQSVVLQDKFDFDKELFCKELAAFFSDRFFFDSLTVDAVEGKSDNLVLCVNIKNVKKSRNVG